MENNVVYNGDDCMTISSPARNIVFRNSYCKGGHGLSIGLDNKDGGPATDIKNVMYVICASGAPKYLTSFSKVPKCCPGEPPLEPQNFGLALTFMVQENSLFGTRYKSYIGGTGTVKKYEDQLPPDRL